MKTLLIIACFSASFSPDTSRPVSLSVFDHLVNNSITLLDTKRLSEISDTDHINIMMCLNTIFMAVQPETFQKRFTGGNYEKLERVVHEKAYTKNIIDIYPDWTPNRGMGYYFPKLKMELYGTPGSYAIFDVRYDTAGVDSLFTDLVKNNEFNGNVAATADGKIVYQHSFGYADAEHQVPNSDQTSFNLASVSKIFTAIAILQLKQKGKLSLDDPYVKYFPDFPWPAITLRHLLSHTSGLPDNQIFEQPYRENPNKIYTLDDLIPAFKTDKRGLLFNPGEKFSYSNTGFGLLALLVEKRSGMKFQHYLKKYIFLPASMSHTYIETPLIPVVDPGRAVRYEFISYAPESLRRVDSVTRDHISAVILGAILGPDGVVSTTGDMQAFDQALYSGKLLKPAILEEAFRPTLLNNGEKAVLGVGGDNTNSYYGLGWMILCDSTYGKVVWHSGGDPGEVTLFLRNITKKQTIIVLDNVTHRGLLSQGINAFCTLNGGPAQVFKRSLARAYARQLMRKGPDAAAVLFNELKTDTAHYYPMNERELNGICYDLMDDGHMTEALEALKINTILFPDSWNGYDSYAEALARAGKKEEAVAMYKRSIALNPGNQGGKKALQQLETK